MWIAKRLLDRAMAMNVAAFGIGGLIVSLKRRPVPTALCTVAEVALLLYSWQLMSKYYEEHRNSADNARRGA